MFKKLILISIVLLCAGCVSTTEPPTNTKVNLENLHYHREVPLSYVGIAVRAAGNPQQKENKK